MLYDLLRHLSWLAHHRHFLKKQDTQALFLEFQYLGVFIKVLGLVTGVVSGEWYVTIREWSF